MLETEVGPLGFFTPCCDDSSEEGLSVLPRHTKVVVTGNNRTKSVLVGLHGVVKKAVGLGGWHWLVLTNGVEVKLQRNALSVIEAPTGDEEDDDNNENPFSSGTSLEDDFPRTFKPIVQPLKPITLMPHPLNEDLTAEEAAPFRHSLHGKKEVIEEASSASDTLPRVDLSKLETAALRRYRRHFKLVEVGPNSSKEQLVHVVGRHFMSQKLDEFQVITGFLQAAKRLKS